MQVQWDFAWSNGVILAVLIVMMAFSGAARAQSCSPDFDFSDPDAPRYRSSDASAFQGYLSGNVYGEVRRGKLLALNLRLSPDFNGPEGLMLMTVNFSAAEATNAPKVICRPFAGGLKITIAGVPAARQYFRNAMTYSCGTITLVLFIESGPGEISVQYRHRAFSRSDAAPPQPFNGLVARATPQKGARLRLSQR